MILFLFVKNITPLFPVLQKQVDNINAVVDFKVLTELLGIGLLLTIISSLSACIAIARFSPLTILKERS